jgi:beta-xylosidase
VKLLIFDTLDAEKIDVLRPVFTEELIPIDVLAKDILKVSPRLVRSNEKWYILQSLYRMLRSKLFRIHSVDASEWVYRQMQHCNDETPLPTVLTKIIRVLVTKYVFC